MKKNYIMILLLSGLLCSAASYYGTKLPLPGATITDIQTQSNTIGKVFSAVSKQEKRCRKISIKNTKVEYPLTNATVDRNGRKTGGTWGETWTVNACGKDLGVFIYFNQTKNGVESIVTSIK